MEKTGIIIGGGDLTPAFAEKIIRESGSRGSLCIAAADAGLEILDRIGVAPDILLGDFDTVKQDVLGIYTDRKDVEIIRHNPVKDASDMELTADVLLERGIRRVLVLGALGGRADHTMANLLLIYRMRRKGAEFLILDPRNRIRCLMVPEETEMTGAENVCGAETVPDAEYVCGTETVPDTEYVCGTETVFSLRRDAQWGRYVGLFAVGGTIRHLTLEGFKYPLTDHTLNARGIPSLTISNEILAETGVIRFGGDPGTGLLVMETADRGGQF